MMIGDEGGEDWGEGDVNRKVAGGRSAQSNICGK